MLKIKDFINKIGHSKIGEWCKKHSSFSWAIFFSLLTILLYGFLCFHDNIWYDEAYQMVLNRYSLSDIIYFVSKDFSPPLYAICLKIFTMIFGTSLGVCRLFSLIIYCFTFFLAFFPVQKIFNKKVSFYFSIFLLLLPVSTYISLEIRTYCFAFVFTLAAILYGTLLLKEDSWKNMGLYTLFAIFAMYSHNYSIFCVFIFLWLQLIGSLIRKKSRVKSFLAVIIVLIAFWPWLTILMNQAKALEANFWIETPNLAVLFQCLYFLFGAHKYIVLIIINFFILFLFFSLYSNFKQILKIFYILLPSVLTLIFFVLWSIYKTPMFIPRYTVPVLGAIVLFLACITAFAKKNCLGILLVFILCFPFGYNYYKDLARTNDIETERMIQYINENTLDTKNFFHIGEFSLGEAEYYFPNSEHYYYQNIPIYVTEPKIFGNVHVITLDDLLPKQSKYILISKFDVGRIEEKYGLKLIDVAYFDIPYQGERYVYVLES